MNFDEKLNFQLKEILAPAFSPVIFSPLMPVIYYKVTLT